MFSVNCLVSPVRQYKRSELFFKQWFSCMGAFHVGTTYLAHGSKEQKITIEFPARGEGLPSCCATHCGAFMR